MNVVLLALSAPFLSGPGDSAPAHDRGLPPAEERTASIENRLAAVERQLAAGELARTEVHVAPEPDPSGSLLDGLQVTLDERGLRFRSADGETTMKIGGRVQVDGNVHSRDATHGSGEIADGTELRRARFEMKGTLPGNLIWAAEVDFAGDNTAIKDFWGGWDPDRGPLTTVGHQKQPFSLAVEMSSNDIPFIERSIDNYLVIPFVDRAIGVRVQESGERWFYAGGLFGEGASNGATDDEGWGVTSRFVAAPVKDDDKVLHLATRAMYRIPGDKDQAVRIRDETTNMSNFHVIDTGAGVIDDVDGTLLWGGEAFWACGPFSVGGEINDVHVMRSGSDYNFQSWHVEATASLTGESRAPSYRMDSGEFKRLRPDEDSRFGALEIANRFAYIDTNDGSLRGGQASVGTLGLNWYYNRNLRLMFNWSRYLATGGGSVTTQRADGTDVFSLRLQLTF